MILLFFGSSLFFNFCKVQGVYSAKNHLFNSFICVSLFAANFELKNEFAYSGEGWGICSDGKHLIMSDGTERLTVRDPKSFQALRTIEVYTDQGPLPQLNELEYIDGLIYANIYTTNFVAVIDPQNGSVLALIDASNLVAAAKGTGEVLNGIAHNPKNGKLYMTGKYWPKLVEVSIIK